jgi:hypothetical protein
MHPASNGASYETDSTSRFDQRCHSIRGTAAAGPASGERPSFSGRYN